MPEIIVCPRCQRKLRMDESVIGQTVQCPSCQNTFVAEMPNRSVAPGRADEASPTYRVVDEDVPPGPREDRRSSRNRQTDDDEDYPRPPRRKRFDDYRKPHRGSTVRTLGILSLVFAFIPFIFALPALILSIVTISMAASDLSAMRRGEMDQDGRHPTKTGMICAILAIPLMALSCFGCFGMQIFNDLR